MGLSSTEGWTFEDFARLAKSNGWRIHDLAREFCGGLGGKPDDPGYESPRAFFERVFAGKPSRNSVIVCRPVVEKYIRAVRYTAIGDHVRRCACGCGRPIVFSRKRYYSDACRQRLKRARDWERAHGSLRNAKDRLTISEAFP